MKKRRGGGGKLLLSAGLWSKVASGFVVIALLLLSTGAVVRGQGVDEEQTDKIRKLEERVEALETVGGGTGGDGDLKTMVDEMWASYQKKKEKEKLFSFTIHGLAKNWALSQNKFRFGRDNIRDTYVVSLFRILPNISTLGGDVKFIGRFDIAQGWWGVDNDRGTFIDWHGDMRNASNLFSNKETNYAFHADWAHIDFRIPFIPKDYLTRAKFGRMWFGAGNKLVLDYDYDGIQTITKHGPYTMTLGWAKVTEGYMGLSDHSAKKARWDALSMGAVSGNDANLWLAKVVRALPEKKGKIEGYYIYYNDAGTDDGTAYLSDGIDYSQARFRPQIGKLHVLGAAGDYKLGKLSIKGEFDFLTGRDDIDNSTYNSSGIPFGSRDDTSQTPGLFGSSANAAAGRPGYLPPHFYNRLDKNSGTLSGWNAYVNLKYNDALNAGKPGFHHITPGLIIGAGSGDKDPTSGKGNINKIQTEGWFYVSEVWEDSIMPDLTGITPQGLGSPWSRGYREFENQVLIQPNITWKFHPKWKLFLSYQHVRAMRKIYAWAPAGVNPAGPETGRFLWTDGAGTSFADEAAAKAALDDTTPDVEWEDESHLYKGGPDKSSGDLDIGDEVDWRLTYKVFSNLAFDLRGGIFVPGDAASNLIAGSDSFDAVAWEGRWDITFKF